MAIEPEEDERRPSPASGDLEDRLAAAETAWSEPDRVRALDLWAALREEFPFEAPPYLRAAEALGELGRVDEAEALLLDGRRRFPGALDFAIARARLLRRNGEGAAAASLCAAFRKAEPDHPAGYVEGALCLRDLERFEEADALLEEAMARLPPDADLLVNHAWVAYRRGDWPEALRRWKAALISFPEDPSPYFGMGAALCELGHFAQADAVLGPAVERFPGHADILVNYARVAQRAGEEAEALRRWQLACAALPDDAEPRIGQAAALEALGRGEEAGLVLAEAVARLPTNLALLSRYARAAQERRDWAEALRRWERMRAQDGDDPAGAVGVAVALRELGRFEEADAVLASAMATAPEDPDLAVNHAWIADYRGDWLEALGRWESVRARFPDDASPYFGAGAALRELGRFDEADRVFVAAIERFPGHLDVLVNYARVATSRGEILEARRRWEAVRLEFPDDSAAQEAVAIGLAAVDASPLAPSDRGEPDAGRHGPAPGGSAFPLDRLVRNISRVVPRHNPQGAAAPRAPEHPADTRAKDPLA